MTTTGTGTEAQLGFAIEATKNTRQAPNRFVPFVQEGITVPDFYVASRGLAAGKRYKQRVSPGQKAPAGPINMELQSETILDLLKLAVGSVSTTGTDPYVHVVTPGALPSATFQLGRPTSDATDTAALPFDYTGGMCRSLTISSGDPFAEAQIDLVFFDELKDQTLATYAESTTITPLLSQQATITTPDGERCFDSWSVVFANEIESVFRACAANTSAEGAALATLRENGWRAATGVLGGDFEDLTAYNRYLAGSTGTLTIELIADASDAKYKVSMPVRYTGETPNVSGPEVVKQGIPFEQIGETLVVTLTNTDSNA